MRYRFPNLRGISLKRIIEKFKIKKYQKDLILYFLTLAFYLVLTTFIATPIIVNGKSMEPTLHGGNFGISMILDKTKLDRFDIVTLESKEDGKILIKRVIGLPGETIEYKAHKLYVNGEYVEEPFLREGTKTYKYDVIDGNIYIVSSAFKIELKEDEIFCLGDNREVSKDSRVLGAFKLEDVVSKNFFGVIPWGNIE